MIRLTEKTALKQTPAIDLAGIQLLRDVSALHLHMFHRHGAAFAAEIVNELPLDDFLVRISCPQTPDLDFIQCLPEVFSGVPVPNGNAVDIVFIRLEFGYGILNGMILDYMKFQMRIL